MFSWRSVNGKRKTNYFTQVIKKNLIIYINDPNLKIII